MNAVSNRHVTSFRNQKEKVRGLEVKIPTRKRFVRFDQLLRHGRDMFCYKRSGDNYTLERGNNEASPENKVATEKAFVAVLCTFTILNGNSFRKDSFRHDNVIDLIMKITGKIILT